MARRPRPGGPSDTLRPPRIPDELLARALAECDTAGEFDLEGARVEADADGASISARWVEIVESDLTAVTFDAGVLRHLDVRDSVFRMCDLSNVATRRGSVRRAELRQSRLVGFTLTDGDVEDVRAVGGSMMLASFEQSRLQRVVFDEVDLREVSFAGAHLAGVAFLDCDLAGADFRGARLRNCLMRGATLDGVAGIESLRGLAMPWPDLVASTGALAAALGITVAED
jgi:uncharacterized protein YjbI with pentapeptide repeats